MNGSEKGAVRKRDRGRCRNCGASGPDVTLDRHHVVPRSQGGSNRLSNLILLCRQCHDAAHGKTTAPTVQFSSTGDMDTASFQTFVRFFSELPSARFNSDTKSWEVPKADFEQVVEMVVGSQDQIVVADGGKE